VSDRRHIGSRKDDRMWSCQAMMSKPELKAGDLCTYTCTEEAVTILRVHHDDGPEVCGKGGRGDGQGLKGSAFGLVVAQRRCHI
jgi:hypothetical protein